MNKQEINNLIQFGFTGLEAEIYITLLQEPNSTGYRIAQVLGKPVPNTYKALNNLKTKNIITVDESAKTQLFSALPIGDYLNAKESEFKKRRTEIETQLKRYEIPKVAGGISRIDKVDAIFSRVHKLISDAEQVVLVDAFPRALQRLADDLQTAAKNGKRVVVKAYQPVSIPGCEVIFSKADSHLADKFFGDWLNIVVDGRESLLSFIDPENQRVFEAFWCNNLFLSLLLYNGFHHEMMLAHLKEEINNNRSTVDLKELISEYDPDKTSNLRAMETFFNKFKK